MAQDVTSLYMRLLLYIVHILRTFQADFLLLPDSVFCLQFVHVFADGLDFLCQSYKCPLSLHPELLITLHFHCQLLKLSC